ncbi:LUD domain-containing protein [Urechidicola vernalis]|uniref:LUD domain-containing protein n=1 Tax=Urechidicola vernalis TaxID=3075600 RepID=A0ABU2Y442_9FLAO|nr:LUD domain-containing protein [Urechidicola sp. P050]MDT0552419.1 hypothetical protein [Urechidicola sp. P050]
MSFFKKIFKKNKAFSEEEIKEQRVTLSLDDSFVHNFIKLGGKFLYCLKNQDVTNNIQNILEENDWDTISVRDADLNKYISSVKVHTDDGFNKNIPFFTSCESLISENGNILFCERQLNDKKLATLSNDFIVFATTSQIVKSKGESLTGIKLKYKKNIPGNISPIKNYGAKISNDDFMNYGTTNSKNLYLLLLEDL